MQGALDMDIDVTVNGRELPGTNTLKAQAYGRICRVLKRFPGTADRVTVTVSDRGSHVYQCRIQLWVDGVVVMVVQVEHVDPVTGVDRAADRVRCNLARIRQRALEISDRSTSSRSDPR